MRRNKMQYKGLKRIKKVAALVLSAALITTELPQTGIVYASETDEYETQMTTEQEESLTQQEESTTEQEENQTEDNREEDTNVEESAEESEIESDHETKTESAESTEVETQSSTETSSAETESDVETTSAGTTETETEGSTESTSTKPTETETESSTESTSTKPTETETEDNTESNTSTETETENSTETSSVGTTETEDETNTIETEETTETETEDSTELEATEVETLELETVATEIAEKQTSVPIPEVDASVHTVKSKKNIALFDAVSSRIYASAQEPVEVSPGEYKIENRDQFLGFLSGRLDYDGCTVTLACNIDMKSETVYFGDRFAGTFDGNGYSIQNLKVDQGLFPVIQSGAVVKNLHISNASLTGERSAGVIVGRNNGTIRKCVVTGNLEATSNMDFTAGIAGINEGTIENCVFAGRITAVANTADEEKNIGGIAGENNGEIQNCYAMGSINTKAAVVAGIAGTNTNNIKDCANYMNIEGAYTVAGIVAMNEDNVLNCTNYGTVRQKNNSQEIGEAGGITAQNKLGTISDSYNYAIINGEAKNIGGIAATTSGAITRCGNTGSVTGLANVGGIVGLYNGNREYSISECYNQGSINGSGRTEKSIGIGGVLGSTGESYRVQIENCYNTGSIRAANTAQYLGGIAGIIYKGSISNCYNAGNVAGAEASYAATLVGFFGKEEDTSYTNCLYIGNENSIAFYRENGGVSDAEMAKTTSELRSRDVLTILGNSFSLDSGSSINDGYPILSEQTEPSYQYLVVYELNGGCSENSYFELITQDSSVNRPEDPTKNYAEFQDWYTDAGLSNLYRFNDSVKAPLILYAKWKNVTIVEDMELLQTSIELIRGEEYPIKVRFIPEKAENAEMVWDSDNTSAVTVDEKGVIRAEAPGRATITGRLKDNSLSKTLELDVTVTKDESIIHIRRVEDGAELENLDIAVKEVVTLEAVTKGFSEETAETQWGPGDNEYVKITPKVNTLGNPKVEVMGLKPTPSGKPVKVKFTVDDGNIQSSKSINVTVLPLATGVKVKLDEEDVTDKTAIYDLVTKKFIAVGTKKLKKPVEKLSAVVSPSDASQKVTWESNNSSVIQFKDEEIGVVTGNISGTAEVTALTKDGSNKTGKLTVRTKRIVQSFVLEPKAVDTNTPVVLDSQGRVLLTSGCSVRLVPNFTPTDATDQGLKWEMRPKNCIEIDAEKRIITAKDVGSETKVIVKATSMDGGEASYEMEFIIIPRVESIEIYNAKDMKRPINGETIGVNPETDSKTVTLCVKNKPDDASQIVLWKSANTKVATVEDHKDGSCTVTVNGYGKTTIIATAADGSGITASVTINVSSLVSSINIIGSSKVTKGGTIKLKAEVFPKSAENKAVYWESDDTSIATVNRSTGEVKGIKNGFADIIATAADGGGASQTFAIRVTEPVTDFDIMIPDGNTNLEDDVIVTDKMVGIDLDAGMETYTLSARILPKEASQIVSWKSSNEKIATVDEKGTVTAKALGRAIITATTTDGSNKTAKTTVNVNTLVRNVSITGSHYVGAGQSIQLHAKVTDIDAANKNVIWTSSDKRAVVVDSNGYVTAVNSTGEATATIRAEAADGSGKYAEHIVYVMGKSDQIEITEFNGSLNSKKSSEIDIQKISRDHKVSFVAQLSGGSSQQGNYDKEVEWLTSNKSIAEVYSIQNNYGYSEAIIQIKKEGKVTITARTTDGSNRQDSYTLTVTDTDPDVTITGPRQVANGKKIQLSTEGGVAVTWSTSDPSLATVDSKGRVTGKKNVEGTVIITATSKKGSEKTGIYYVEVCPAVSSVDILADGVSIKDKKVGVDLIRGYTLDNGKTWNNNIKFYASVAGASYDERVTWKSNKTAVATVDENGKVEIKKNGTAVITATATDGSGKKAKVTLTVTKQITKIEPADGIQDIYVGYKKSVQLKLAFKPLAATTKKVTWESDDKSLVSVNKSGKVTVKKPFGSGDYDTSSDNNVIVRAIAADGGTAVCEFRIHFVAPATKVQIVEQKDNVNLEYASIVGIDIDTNDAKITLKADIKSKSSYFDQYGVSKQVTWKSSNSNIAEVTPNYDGSCTVTGHTNGKVTITATAADGSKKSGKVTLYVGKMIKSIDVTKDIWDSTDKEGREIITLFVRSVKNKKTLQLSDKLVIHPITATNKKLTYKSSNSKLVSVSASGKLTAKKKGTEDVIITITANDGSRVKKEIVVKIMQ